jgi:uncharacterized membrane protein YeaQ/YmgE (transglycosylase-associated protein family)
MKFVGDTIAGRVSGERPSRTRAAIVSAASGAAVAVVVYKLLRSERGTAQQ